MGLLVTSDGEKDFKAIERVAKTVAGLWNEYGGQDHGFQIVYGTDEIEACSTHASSIFKRFFPDPPGPFKRVAALLVFGRLFPFFAFNPPRPSPVEREEWLSRVVALMLPVALRLIRADIASHPGATTWKSIDAWKGFPSVHYKIEFLAFLQWLDNFDWVIDAIDKISPPPPVDKRALIESRLARMILATSLTIEACYYASEGLPAQASQAHLRGKCVGCIDPKATLVASSYDAMLWQNYHKANAATIAAAAAPAKPAPTKPS